MKRQLLTALLVIGPVLAQAGTTGSITGTVCDSQSGEPVANARVDVYTGSHVDTTRSDARGTFTFSSIAPGAHTVSAVDYDFWDASSCVDVRADATSRLALPMLSNPNHSIVNTEPTRGIVNRDSGPRIEATTCAARPQDVYAVKPPVAPTCPPRSPATARPGETSWRHQQLSSRA